MLAKVCLRTWSVTPEIPANPLQTGADCRKGAIAGGRGEHIWIACDLRLRHDNLDRFRPDRSDLSICLGVRESDEASHRFRPCPLHGLPLLATIAGQQQQSDDGNADRANALLLGIEHRLAQRFNLGDAEASRLFIASELLGTLCRVFGKQALMLRMAQDGLKGRQAACCNTGPTDGLAAPTVRSRLFRLSGRHIVLHRLDIGNRQMTGDSFTEQRFDVGSDSALIHRE